MGEGADIESVVDFLELVRGMGNGLSVEFKHLRKAFGVDDILGVAYHVFMSVVFLDVFKVFSDLFYGFYVILLFALQASLWLLDFAFRLSPEK